MYRYSFYLDNGSCFHHDFKVELDLSSIHMNQSFVVKSEIFIKTKNIIAISKVFEDE